MDTGSLIQNLIRPAVILMSAWSAGKIFLDAGSRSLCSLALAGQAPRTCNRNGVRCLAVAITVLLAFLAYFSVSSDSAIDFT